MNEKNKFCGIECVFQSTDDIYDYLSAVCFEIKGYYFRVVDYLVLSNGRKVFLPSSFEPECFKNIFHPSYCTEQLVLHLYSHGCSAENIDTYRDYLLSKCEMLILMYDSYYVEIYCKNYHLMQTLVNEAAKIKSVLLKMKKEDTDTRKSMWV